MKRLVQSMFVLAATATAVSTAAAQATAGKVAYVRVQDVVAQMPGYAAKQDTVDRDIRSYQDQLQRVAAQYDSAMNKFSQGSAMMSQTVRDAEQTKLRDQANALNSLKTDLQNRAVQRQQEVLGPMNAKITDAIEAVRAAGSYSMVFDVTNQGTGILAADKSLDLTDKVIARVKGTTTATVPPAAPPATGGAPRKP